MSAKKIIITGAASGIGAATKADLEARGAEVIGLDKNAIDDSIIECDVRDQASVDAAVAAAVERLGGLDVLINNAGVGIFRHVRELSVEEWKRTIETNLYGAFYCSREALFRFGTKSAGYIVNIGSLAGSNAFAGGAAYNASKFGLTGFTDAMMQDVRSENVKVSYIMPGSVATEFGGHPRDGADWKIWPEDVAEIVQMLLRMPPRTLVSRVEVRPARVRSSSGKA